MPPRDVAARDRKPSRPARDPDGGRVVNSIRSGFVPNLHKSSVNRIRSGFIAEPTPEARDILAAAGREGDEKTRQTQIGEALAGVLTVVAPPVGLLLGGVLAAQQRGILPADARPRRGPTNRDDTEDRPRRALTAPGPEEAPPPPPAPAGTSSLTGRGTRRVLNAGSSTAVRKRRLLGV